MCCGLVRGEEGRRGEAKGRKVKEKVNQEVERWVGRRGRDVGVQRSVGSEAAEGIGGERGSESDEERREEVRSKEDGRGSDAK